MVIFADVSQQTKPWFRLKNALNLVRVMRGLL